MVQTLGMLFYRVFLQWYLQYIQMLFIARNNKYKTNKRQGTQYLLLYINLFQTSSGWKDKIKLIYVKN